MNQSAETRTLADVLSELPFGNIELEDYIELAFTSVINLNLGSKKMKITYWHQDGMVESYIKNDPEKLDQKIPEETRTLYSLLDTYCQALANQTQTVITHKLLAQHPTMQKWAATHSQKIFQWDGSPQTIARKDGTVTLYTKTYEPET
jgi:hypothetical protein